MISEKIEVEILDLKIKNIFLDCKIIFQNREIKFLKQG